MANPRLALLRQQGTILILQGMGIALYSTRGCTQTYGPIAASMVQRRTVNADLVDLSYPQFQKLTSEITCHDRRAPALDGIWPGRIISVWCVAEFAYPVGGVPDRPERTDIPAYVEGNFVRYLPIINMRVGMWTTSNPEWEADVAWKLPLEEV